MQTTYHVTCKCGHDFPIPARFLSPDEDERAALLKALEGLPCADCIRADVEKTHAMREDFLGIRAAPLDIYPKPEPEYPSPISKDVLAILHAIDSWNHHHPIGTEVYVNPTDVDQPYDPYTHRTTSPAMLRAGKPVVEVSGLGPIHMERLNPFVH